MDVGVDYLLVLARVVLRACLSEFVAAGREVTEAVPDSDQVTGIHTRHPCSRRSGSSWRPSFAQSSFRVATWSPESVLNRPRSRRRRARPSARGSHASAVGPEFPTTLLSVTIRCCAFVTPVRLTVTWFASRSDHRGANGRGPLGDGRRARGSSPSGQRCRPVGNFRRCSSRTAFDPGGPGRGQRDIKRDRPVLCTILRNHPRHGQYRQRGRLRVHEAVAVQHGE